MKSLSFINHQASISSRCWRIWETVVPQYDRETHRAPEKEQLGKRRGKDSRKKFYARRMALITPKEIQLLRENYTFQYASADPIACYETDLLTIMPRFEGRPTKHIFLTKENGIILCVEDLEHQGNLRFMSMYTHISFQPEEVRQQLVTLGIENRSTSDTRRRRSRPISLAEAEKILDNQLVQPSYLPSGFQLQHVLWIESHSETVHLLYTEGLMGISLFESKRNSSHKRKRNGERRNRRAQNQQISGISDQIVAHRHVHILRWSVKNVRFTLISELSRFETIRIAESLISNCAKTAWN